MLSYLWIRLRSLIGVLDLNHSITMILSPLFWPFAPKPGILHTSFDVIAMRNFLAGTFAHSFISKALLSLQAQLVGSR
jgi:hypothetical protein